MLFVDEDDLRERGMRATTLALLTVGSSDLVAVSVGSLDVSGSQ